MPKVTLDMNTFKALASNTRLDILKVLDGKKLNLKDICTKTKLNKATLHEHLTKLSEAGLVKRKERTGHKWVYYCLTWQGECLLHPENTKIVVLFSLTFFTIAAGIVQMISFLKGKIIGKAVNFIGGDYTTIYSISDEGKKGISEALLGGSSGGTFSQSPIAEVPLDGQSTIDLSNEIIKNSGKAITHPDSIDWIPAPDSAYGFVNETFRFNLQTNASQVTEKIKLASNDALVSSSNERFVEGTSNIPQNMLAITYDQSVQNLSIALIIVAGILLSIAIWRYYKNKNTKF